MKAVDSKKTAVDLEKKPAHASSELQAGSSGGSLFQVKRASYEDMFDVAQFIRSSADWYRPFLSEKDLDEHYVGPSWIRKNFGRREFFVGQNHTEESVGTVSLQPCGEDYLYVGYCYIHTDHVGKGHGRKLLNFAVKKAKEQGKKGLCLIAHPKATWAVKAYDKFGFKRIATQSEDILKWNNGFFKPYYEEGFHLYTYEIDQD